MSPQGAATGNEVSEKILHARNPFIWQPPGPRTAAASDRLRSWTDIWGARGAFSTSAAGSDGRTVPAPRARRKRRWIEFRGKTLQRTSAQAIRAIASSVTKPQLSVMMANGNLKSLGSKQCHDLCPTGTPGGSPGIRPWAASHDRDGGRGDGRSRSRARRSRSGSPPAGVAGAAGNPCPCGGKAPQPRSARRMAPASAAWQNCRGLRQIGHQAATRKKEAPEARSFAACAESRSAVRRRRARNPGRQGGSA